MASFTHAAGIPQNHTSSRIAEGRGLPEPVSAEEAEVQLQATRKAEHENHLKPRAPVAAVFT